MNDIQAIGETEIILRNAQTLEIEERIVQKNRITPYIWGQIPWGGAGGTFSDVFYGTYTQNLGIISGFGYATSNTFIRISVNPLINSNAVCGYSDGTYLNSIKADAVIPTVGTGLQVFTAFDSNGPYFQFNGRYNQPASNRNVGAVLLSNRKVLGASDYGDTYESGGYIQTYTIANMQTACTQTTSQIMDIYYRIFFTSSTKSNTEVYNWLIAKSLDIGSLRSYSYTGEFCSSYRIPSDFKSMYWNSPTTCLAGNNINNYTTRPLVSYRSYDFSAYATNVNRFVNSWVNCPNFGAYNNFNHPTKFGNTFGTNVNSTSYMQDVNNLASGNGTLAVTGVWNPSPTSNSNGLYYPTSWPKQMILTVTDSGKASDSTAKFNYSERPICPGSSLPYLSSLCNNYGPLGDPSVNWPYWLACRTIRYDNCSIILIGYDRIIVYNIPGGKTYTITGSFTKLCQCAVSGTKIYMACRNTGLWVVDPTVSLTPTKVSLSTNNACYGVDAARDGVVWALTDGGLYKLNSSGTVTANYTSSTSVALNVSLNSWTDFTYVNGLVVDKYVSSQLVLCADLVFHTFVSTNKSVLWFDETNGSTIGPTFSWAGSCQSTNQINIGVYNSGAYTTPRTVITQGSGSYNHAFKKNSTSSFSSVLVELASVSFDDLLSTETCTWTTGYSSTASGFYVTDISLNNGNGSYRQLTGTTVSNPTFQGSLVAYDGSTKQTVISADCGGAWFQQHVYGWHVYMGNGIIVRIPYIQADNSTSHYTDNVYSLFDYTTKWTGVPFDSTFTTTYGWNGSAWVKGSTTGKPMGTGTHTLPGNASGITVQFADPASGTSFVATDKYTTILYDGFFKDNATIATMRHDFYMCPTDQGLTDLESNTIPSAPLTTPKTGYVTTIRNATSAPTVNGDSSLTFTGVGQCPIMYDASLHGDWEVDMIVPASNSAFPSVMTFGVVSDGANLVHCSATPIANITVSSYLGKTLRIVKVGNVITWYQGTTSISSQTLTTNQAGSYGRYAIRVYVGSTTASFTVPPVNIISNNTGSTYLPTLRIGNSTNNTGAYNSRFFRVDVESIQSGDVKINGVTATVLTDGTPPSTGQCSILPYSGYITFSTADIGKSVSTSLTVLYP